MGQGCQQPIHSGDEVVQGAGAGRCVALHTECHERCGIGAETADGECRDAATGIRQSLRNVYVILTTDEGAGVLAREDRTWRP